MCHLGQALGPVQWGGCGKTSRRKTLLRRSPSRGALGETPIIRTHIIEPLGNHLECSAARKGGLEEGGGALAVLFLELGPGLWAIAPLGCGFIRVLVFFAAAVLPRRHARL